MYTALNLVNLVLRYCIPFRVRPLWDVTAHRTAACLRGTYLRYVPTYPFRIYGTWPRAEGYLALQNYGT